MLKENVSLSWLHGGVGAPYNVRRASTSQETFELLKQSMESGFENLFLVSGYTALSFIFTQDVSEDREDYTLKYIQAEIISGAVSTACLDLFKDKTVFHCPLSFEQAERVSLGFIGTYELFGSTDCLALNKLGHAGLTKKSELIESKELITLIKQNAVNRDEIMINDVLKMVDETLLEAGAKLTPDQKRKITVELYHSMVKEGYEINQAVHDLAKTLLRVVS